MTTRPVLRAMLAEVAAAERERTPPAFAEFLVRIARASRVDRRVAA